MVFIYTTDLHGDVLKYEAVLKFAQEQKINLVHLGADLLPKGSGILSQQKKFINGYLKKYYKRCKDLGIDVLAFFGNDDIYTRKKYFLKYATLLDETPYSKNGYDFRAYGFVPDYPFGLKTACKLDYDGWKCPDPYLGRPLDCGPKGLEEIPDIEKYFIKKGTIENDLKNIHVITDKTIMATHAPPWSLDLDVCRGGRRVGSKSVYDWIKNEKPLVVLSGHIHESYDVSKVWKAKIGKTTVIQPGQLPDKTHIVVISVQNNEVVSELFLKGKETL